MKPTTINALILGCALILGITFGRSILLMLGGNKLFDKAKKNPKNAFMPILNLFTLLDVCEMSTFWGILLFIPFTNLVVLTIMSIRLKKLFGLTGGFCFGLIFIPIIFYPLLCAGEYHYKLTEEEYFRALDNARDESINLMTDEDIKAQNEAMKAEVEAEPKTEIDSVFKSDISMKEPVGPYKAKKVDILKSNVPDNTPDTSADLTPIKKIEVKPKEDEDEEENVQVKSKFTSELDNKDNAEYVDL